MDSTDSLAAIRKILIVGPAWIGDMVMAQSLFKLLKQQNPQVELHLLASAWTRQLLACMPEVDDVIDMPVGHGRVGWGERKALGRALADKGYDQAIVLPNSFKSALIPFFAKIPKRTGWLGELRFGLLTDHRRLDKSAYPLMVQRYMALAFAKGYKLPADFPRPHLQVDSAQRPQLLTKFALQLDRPLLILCPGAEYGPAKRWPEAYYAEVAAQKIAQGWQVWLMGSAKDQPVAETICQLLPEVAQPRARNLAGATSLGEAIALMACADLVLTNDSGLIHTAAALQRPLVVVYGSTSPEFTPPLAEKVRIESIAIECSPCFQRECPKVHLKCLRELQPAQVLAAIDTLVGQVGELRVKAH